MKLLFSDEERTQTVRNWLIACQNKRGEIINYKEITECLNSERVKTLCRLPKSSSQQIGLSQYRSVYTNGDAKFYYDWLVGVVSGTEHEGITEEIIKQANDQLFFFIHIMQNANDIKMDKNVELIVPYDWQKLFLSFDRKLIDIKDVVNHHDQDVLNVLKSILELLKKNKILLDTLQKEYESYFPKGESS